MEIPSKVMDETVLAVMDILNHELSDNALERFKPSRELSVVTIAESGYYNVWYLPMYPSAHGGEWAGTATHHSHAHSYEKALIHATYKATEYTEH